MATTNGEGMQAEGGRAGNGTRNFYPRRLNHQTTAGGTMEGFPLRFRGERTGGARWSP